ncbi:chain-length determining protein [Paenarthrobacter sp. NPDC056912]|uniref:chain-length determining protein n=1 Tax=Paenarthrobacter sp. NPDC056912 TaxID=3345965 RepID=UPI00366AA941
MDPIAVLKTLWHHKLVVLPVLLLTAIAAVYVYSFAPRLYEAKATYAIVNPKIPSEAEMEKDPALRNLNADNPYLRSADSSLIAQVVATRLSDDSTGEAMKSGGLSTDFTVARPPSSFLIEISAAADSKESAIATVHALGTRLEEDLKTIQSVNGAAEQYLFTSIMIAAPDDATEQFSSRLRSLIVVAVAGLVLVIGAVSAARGVEAARERSPKAAPRRQKGTRKKHSDTSSNEAPPGKSPEAPAERSKASSLKHRDELAFRDVMEHGSDADAFPGNETFRDTINARATGKTAVKETRV